MKNDKITKHQFSADRPITSRKEDLLGRSDFTESLASAIKGWTGNDSLVIALYGPWGSGKSSIKNMVLESLHTSKDDCPFIIEFNPWQWGGQEQLAEAFFQEIGFALDRADTSKEGKKRVAKWQTYAAYLKVGSFLAGGLRSALSLIFVIVGLIGVGAVFVNRLTLIIVSAIFLLVAAVIKWGGEFADKISTALAARFEERKQSLPEIKNELVELMQDLNKPFLVVMDDVDRLSSDEIKLLFQLVKANADFPNMVYLLLFQRNIVENSIEDFAPTTGREFLEKIIQVGFDIPCIERTRLEKVLFAGLDKLLADEKVGQRFNTQRWGNIFIPGLHPYFNTLRDVHRFLGTLSFHISLFKNTGSFEVNPIDLIALEVLRVFEPEVYKLLHSAKSALTELRDLNLSKDANDHTRNTVEAVVNQAHEENRTIVRIILKQLFPSAEWVLGGSIYGPDFGEQWFRDLRVCHPDVFDRYSHLTIPEGDISWADLERILSLAGNREFLADEFSSLNQRGLLGIALDRLEAYKEKIDLQHAVPFIAALMDVGDKLPDESSGWFTIESDMHASRIIHWYLKQEKDVVKRGRILKEAIKNTVGLYLPVMKISIEDSRQERQKDPEALIVAEDDLKDLEEICVEKIRNAATSAMLQSNPKLAYILYRWCEWASPEEPREWVKHLIDSKEGLFSFLVAFLSQSKSHGMGDYVYRTHWRISLKSIEDFVPVDIIEEKINELKVDELSEKEQLAIRAFQKALKKREEGKSDDGWRVDEDE